MPANKDDGQKKHPLTISLETSTLDGNEQIFETLDSRLFSDTLDASQERKVNPFPKDSKLILSVEHKGTKRTLSIEKRLILGRKAPESVGPLVDLTGAGAFQFGVSRQHAVLRRTSDNYLLIKDMGSKNGTFINGKRLLPLQRYLLNHDDRLQLGELALRVLYDPAPAEAADG